MSGFATTSSVWTNMTKNLWDKTKVIGTTWAELRKEAMKSSFKQSEQYKTANPLERDVLDELIIA